jgi:hypothetical protein
MMPIQFAQVAQLILKFQWHKFMFMMLKLSQIQLLLMLIQPQTLTLDWNNTEEVNTNHWLSQLKAKPANKQNKKDPTPNSKWLSINKVKELLVKLILWQLKWINSLRLLIWITTMKQCQWLKLSRRKDLRIMINFLLSTPKMHSKMDLKCSHKSLKTNTFKINYNTLKELRIMWITT